MLSLWHWQELNRFRSAHGDLDLCTAYDVLLISREAVSNVVTMWRWYHWANRR